MTLENAIDRYYRLIHSYVFGRTGKDKYFADECTNDIFFLFWLKAENKIKDEFVFSWLLKSANNKIKEYYRRKKKEIILVQIDEFAHIPVDKVDLVDRIIKEKDIEEAKDKLLSSLNADERQMYEDYFTHKMTYVEIADKLGIDRNTAAKKLLNIRKKLTDEANKIFGITGSATVLYILSSLLNR